MHVTRSPRRRVAAFCVSLISCLCLGHALAQTYPAAPIRLLVGTPAGGTTDVIARLIAAKMGESLGQSVVVENKTGASGLIAAESVAKAAPDGYTLLMASSQLATYRALYPSTTFDPERDMDPVGIVATSPYVMVVHPSLPVKSFAELIAYAKAHPGVISYAGSTPGTAQHLGWEMIKRKTGTDMQYVPYKGTSALMPDLLAGRLQAGIDNVAVLTPYIKSGKLRGIAVTSAGKSSLLPDLPTIATSGLPDFSAMGWFGVFSATKLPASAMTALKAALNTALKSADIREKIAGMGAEIQSGSSDDMRALLHRESTVWTKVIQDSGITVQ